MYSIICEVSIVLPLFVELVISVTRSIIPPFSRKFNCENGNINRSGNAFGFGISEMS
jgi:hypothetical protein